MFDVWDVFLSVLFWKCVCIWQEPDADQGLFYFSIYPYLQTQPLQATFSLGALRWAGLSTLSRLPGLYFLEANVSGSGVFEGYRKEGKDECAEIFPGGHFFTFQNPLPINHCASMVSGIQLELLCYH